MTSFGIWAKRGTFVILPGFEPGLLLEAFEAYSGTHTLVVPTMLIAMLDHPDLTRRDLSSLQTIMSGAASVPASLVRKTIGLLGCQFSILFGQTETHGVISQTRVTDTAEDQADTVGQPLPRLKVKIADVATGEPVPAAAGRRRHADLRRGPAAEVPQPGIVRGERAGAGMTSQSARCARLLHAELAAEGGRP